MKLSIIIVSWNVGEDLLRCLESIKVNRLCERFETIVIDNGSTDGTVETVKKSFPEVVIIANDENRGFAAANNQGIIQSKGEYVLLLNPDTIVHSGALDTLISFMDSHPDVGVCGPKLLKEDGSIQRSVRRLPTFRAVLYRHTIFKLIGLFRSQYNKWMMKDFAYDCQKEVFQLMGAALLIRQSVIDEVGLMDETFFMYYEEVDLCYRIKRAGWRIVFIPEAVITHLGGKSAGQIPVDKQIMAMTSLLKFFKKHRGKFITGGFICIFKPAIVATHLINIIIGTIKYAFAAAFNRNIREKSAEEIRNSTLLLLRHSWWSLFKR